MALRKCSVVNTLRICSNCPLRILKASRTSLMGMHTDVVGGKDDFVVIIVSSNNGKILMITWHSVLRSLKFCINLRDFRILSNACLLFSLRLACRVSSVLYGFDQFLNTSANIISGLKATASKERESMQ